MLLESSEQWWPERRQKLLECLQLHHTGECRHLSIRAQWQCSQNPFLRAVLPMEVEVSAQAVEADDKSTHNSSSKVSFSTKIMLRNNIISIFQYIGIATYSTPVSNMLAYILIYHDITIIETHTCSFPIGNN